MFWLGEIIKNKATEFGHKATDSEWEVNLLHRPSIVALLLMVYTFTDRNQDDRCCSLKLLSCVNKIRIIHRRGINLSLITTP